MSICLKLCPILTKFSAFFNVLKTVTHLSIESQTKQYVALLKSPVTKIHCLICTKKANFGTISCQFNLNFYPFSKLVLFFDHFKYLVAFWRVFQSNSYISFSLLSLSRVQKLYKYSFWEKKWQIVNNRFLSFLNLLYQSFCFNTYLRSWERNRTKSFENVILA